MQFNILAFGAITLSLVAHAQQIPSCAVSDIYGWSSDDTDSI